MSAQKKIMFLGGIYYLKPAIDAAHALGCYVITCDNVPNNIAHQWSDEYVNASIIDKEKILIIAREKQIDGILSYAVDPGVLTAAYVAEQLCLPYTCTYESAKILQNKAKFRNFLKDNGFNTPWSISGKSYKEILESIYRFSYPMIVKPVDSAGSKGVTRVDNEEDLETAFYNAIKYSISKEVIVEEFISKKNYSYGAEVFVSNGKVVFSSFYDQLFDIESPNQYVPYAECWPSSIPKQAEEQILSTIQKICDLLKISTGLFNVECRQSLQGKTYLMELSPRAGGNRLAEIIKEATGCDIIEAEVLKAIGEKNIHISSSIYKGAYAIYVLHSSKSGMFDCVKIDSEFNNHHVISETYYINKGDHVDGFQGANNAIGTLFLHFENRSQLDETIQNINDYVNIIIK